MNEYSIMLKVTVPDDIEQGDEVDLVMDQITEAFSPTGTHMGWNNEIKVEILAHF
jgi:hypothetical protein